MVRLLFSSLSSVLRLRYFLPSGLVVILCLFLAPLFRDHCLSPKTYASPGHFLVSPFCGLPRGHLTSRISSKTDVYRHRPITFLRILLTASLHGLARLDCQLCQLSVATVLVANHSSICFCLESKVTWICILHIFPFVTSLVLRQYSSVTFPFSDVLFYTLTIFGHIISNC